MCVFFFESFSQWNCHFTYSKRITNLYLEYESYRLYIFGHTVSHTSSDINAMYIVAYCITHTRASMSAKQWHNIRLEKMSEEWEIKWENVDDLICKRIEVSTLRCRAENSSFWIKYRRMQSVRRTSFDYVSSGVERMNGDITLKIFNFLTHIPRFGFSNCSQIVRCSLFARCVQYISIAWIVICIFGCFSVLLIVLLCALYNTASQTYIAFLSFRLKCSTFHIIPSSTESI